MRTTASQARGQTATDYRRLERALRSLLSRLEHLSRSDLHPHRRIALLRAFKRAIVKASAALPKHAELGRRESLEGGGAVSLELRLYQAMCRNLWRALHGLDRIRARGGGVDDAERQWVYQHLFRFIGRQIRYCIERDQPWPEHVWHQLNDLYINSIVGGVCSADGETAVEVADAPVFDAAVEYKRLLLLGIADRFGRASAELDKLLPMLKFCARDSSLIEPDLRFVQPTGVQFLVDVSTDEAPRIWNAPVDEAFRGWIFKPSEAFVRFLDGGQSGGARVVRFNAFRSAA